MDELIGKARVLIEALPYISEFRGRTVVVKIGGAAQEDPVLRRRFAEDVILLDWVGINVVVAMFWSAPLKFWTSTTLLYGSTIRQ